MTRSALQLHLPRKDGRGFPVFHLKPGGCFRSLPGDTSEKQADVRLSSASEHTINFSLLNGEIPGVSAL